MAYDTITTRAGADWDNDGYIHWHLTNSDYDANHINQLVSSGTPADIGSWDRVTTGTGGSVAVVNNTINQSNYDYGLNYLNWTVGTSAGATLIVGYDGVTPPPEFILSTATQYTAVVWIFNPNASYDAIDLRLRIRAYNGTFTSVIATGSTFNVINGAGWTRQTLTFTSDATYTQHAIVVERPTGTTAASFYVSGLMFVLGASAPTKFNAGSATNFVDNLTDRMISINWNVGFRDLFLRSAMCARGEAKIVCDNSDKALSPEVATVSGGRDLIATGTTGANLVVHEKASSDSAWTIQFYGWVTKFAPEWGTTTKRRCTIVAADRRAWLEDKTVRVAMQESKALYEVVNALLASVDFPDGTTPALGSSPSGSTFSYVGDEWEKPTASQTQGIFLKSLNEIDVMKAITDAVRGDGFVFWLDKAGNPYIKELADFRVTDPSAPSVDYTALGYDLDGSVDYSYGEDIVNSLEMAVNPRKISASSTLTLWTLTDSFTLANGESKTIIARYTNEQEDRTIGGRNVTTTGLTATPNTTGLSVTIDTAYSTSVELTVENTSGADRTVTGLTVQGQKVKSFDTIYERLSDSNSVTRNGRHELKIDTKITQTSARASAIMQYYLDMYADATGRVKSFTLTGHAPEEWFVDGSIMQVTGLADDQTGHSDRYYIVGMNHLLSAKGRETTWYLERVIVDPV